MAYYHVELYKLRDERDTLKSALEKAEAEKKRLTVEKEALEAEKVDIESFRSWYKYEYERAHAALLEKQGEDLKSIKNYKAENARLRAELDKQKWHINDQIVTYDTLERKYNLLSAEMEKLKAENEALKQARRWIPVSERLPEDPGPPNSDRDIDLIAEYKFGEKWIVGQIRRYFFANAEYAPCWFAQGYGEDEEEVEVRAWQPLPPPPSSKKEDA